MADLGTRAEPLGEVVTFRGHVGAIYSVVGAIAQTIDSWGRHNDAMFNDRGSDVIFSS